MREGLRGRIPTVDGGHFGHMSGGHPAAGHPTIDEGEAGVDRTGGTDPGHS